MSLMSRIQRRILDGENNDAIARALREEGDIPQLSVSLENYIQRVRTHLARRPNCPICHQPVTRTTSGFAVRTSEGFVHRDCYARHFRRCQLCGTYIRNEAIVNGPHGERVCQPCRTSRFNSCSICHEEFQSDDLITRGSGETRRLVCRSCREEANLIHNYSWNPRTFKKCKLSYENTTYLGIELETDPKTSSIDLEEHASTFQDFLREINVLDKIYLKEDGSIHGYEIVTHPMTLAYMKKEVNWNSILKFLSKDMVSYDSGCCGMHVHVSKEDMSVQDVLKMRLFFMYAQKELKVLSNRRAMGFHYCQFEHTYEENYEEELTLKKAMRLNPQSGRYWAINLNSSKPTVEIRIFRGTLNYERFMANLMLVDSIVEFCKKISLANFISNRTTIFNVYKEYVVSNAKYQHLVKFIKDNHNGVL